MVYDKIHDDLDSSFVRFIKKAFKILHRSVFFINGAVIANVITVVILRRIVNRRKPNDINQKLLQIIKLLDNTVQITDPVSRRIIKALRINLIYRCLFPPWCAVCFHFSSPPVLF